MTSTIKTIGRLFILPILFLSTNIQCKKDSNRLTVKDIDGNVYKVVKIGDQTWMAEDLRTTKYQNGEPIQYVVQAAAWEVLTTGAYQKNSTTYYNWYAVADVRNIAPKGWHVATDADYIELINYLGGDASKAGSFLKEAGNKHWPQPNTDATNSSGFTALPGSAIKSNGIFEPTWEKFFIAWTNSIDSNTQSPIVCILSATSTQIEIANAGQTLASSAPKRIGCAVRCVKDK